MTTAAKPNQANALLKTLAVLFVLAMIAVAALLFDGGLFFLVLITYVLGAALLSIWRIISSLVVGSEEDEGSLESEADRRRKELVAKRDIKFKIVSELEFDKNLGRLSDADYLPLRAQAVHELIEAEDKLKSEESEQRSSIEAELNKRLRAEGIDTTNTEKAEAKAEAKKPSKNKAKQTSAAACVSCSNDIDPDSVFCKHCGHRQEPRKGDDA